MRKSLKIKQIALSVSISLVNQSSISFIIFSSYFTPLKSPNPTVSINLIGSLNISIGLIL